MIFDFWKRERKKKVVEKIEEKKSSLEDICIKHGYNELYEPMSRLILHNPKRLLNVKDIDLISLASVKIWIGEYKEARKIFEEAIEKYPWHRDRIKKILENFDTVVHITKEWWKGRGVLK